MPDAFIGQPWNTDEDIPTLIDDVRDCPNCRGKWMQTITAYPDKEYWRCHHCGVSTEHEPANGRYGHAVTYTARHLNRGSDQRAADTKRDVDRHYLTARRRRELGLDD